MGSRFSSERAAKPLAAEQPMLRRQRPLHQADADGRPEGVQNRRATQGALCDPWVVELNPLGAWPNPHVETCAGIRGTPYRPWLANNGIDEIANAAIVRPPLPGDFR